MSTYTIYHNPRCGTSRNTLDMLREAEIEPKIVEYLKTPLNEDDLKKLLKKMGISASELLRAKEALAEELNLKREDISEAEIITAMAMHPVLINRPVVETKTRAILCRPKEKLREILP